MNNDFNEKLKSLANEVNVSLIEHFSHYDVEELKGLIEAERYSLLSGGKRIRPILTLATAELFGGTKEAAMPYAIAVEMIHTASLIHDDLPSIDNDDLRRGRLTNHKVFGEATAILAADALFMDSFGVAAENKFVSSELALCALACLSRATGAQGLVGGEYIDVKGEGRNLPLSTLEKIHKMKTGALIRAAVELGALSAGVSQNDPRMADITDYAERIGLAFQIVDDVLDVISTEEELGKPIGSDKEEEKTTFLKFLAPTEALKYASELTEGAILAVSKYEGSQFLIELARFLVERRS